MRYKIGIDLGTTNCALSYFDTLRPELGVQVLPLRQWADKGSFVDGSTLPSFVYMPAKGEWKKGQLNVPLFGEEEPCHYALGQGAKGLCLSVAGRVAHSAKSWLGCPQVDGHAPILPWNSDDVTGDHRLSPVAASSLFLSHLKKTWDAGPGLDGEDSRFSEQTISIGIPASFDEAAQRLTLEAAIAAGYPKDVILVEEPLAAFHLYLKDHPEAMTELLPEQDTVVILVCDVGGGTADFSLFEIRRGEDRLPEVVRTKVSEHLLLGGDNIDISLARLLEPRFGVKTPLAAGPWGQLVAASRRLKEQVLSDSGETGADETCRVAITMGGSSLFASSKTASIEKEDIRQLVLEDFLPHCPPASSVDQVKEQAQMGLEYASDQAFTRHLSHFVDGLKVDACLFAGGSLKPRFMRQRILDVISKWQNDSVLELASDDLDLAITKGCALAPVQNDLIKGGYPRSIFCEVSSANGSTRLICLVPKGYDGRSSIQLADLNLKVVTGKPVQFQIYTYSGSDRYKAGDSTANQGFHKLPPLVTQLETDKSHKIGELVDISLDVSLSPSGLLDIHCKEMSGERKWLLSFKTKQSRSFEVEVESAPVEESLISPQQFEEAKSRIVSIFGKSKEKKGDPKSIVKDLEGLFKCERSEWDLATLRQLWPSLSLGLTRRGRSPEHESSFLYLSGYFLRPGYGDVYDRFRVEELWRLFQLGMNHPKQARIQNQWWIMWRRVSGGLKKDQQEALFRKIYPAIKNGRDDSGEMILLAGALERIDSNLKIPLGQKLVEQILQKKAFCDQRIWALARIASRAPLYAGPESVVRAHTAEVWGESLKVLNLKDKAYSKLALFFASAGRFLDQRELDLSLECRELFFECHRACGAPEYARTPILEKVKVDYKSQNQFFGEDLPNGLIFDES